MMNRIINITFLAMLAFAVTAGCKKPYDPPYIASPGSYLVVEGGINAGSDSTVIKLSRTVSLSSNLTSNPVLGANVSVESDQNVVYPLTETGNGNYSSAGLNLDNSHQYRLSIKTANDQYLSDLVPVLNSPPIDSVNYAITGSGINIYSSTRDPTNTVKYYRWDYQETWIIHSFYSSGFVSNGDTVGVRPPSQQVYQCWASDNSSNIIIGSTARLSQDIVYRNPITSIVSSSEKLGTEYSIQVRQYALTADAYNFYVNLQKNTEQLGSIFDAQPSQINGNIHSVTNPAEPVIGFISAGGTSASRIFIKNQQLPNWVTVSPYTLDTCPLDTEYFVYYPPPGGIFPFYQEDEFYNYDKPGFLSLLIPVAGIQPPGGKLIGHSGSYPACVDCTLRGTNIQPSFWK
jgi:hypothetical protein